MKRIILTAIAILAFGGAARAADLQQGVVSEPAPAGWNGGYLGANIGYGPGTATDMGLLNYIFAFGGGGSLGPISFQGLEAGGQAGYNVIVGTGIVLGVEGDADWTNESGSETATGTSESLTFSTKMNWNGDLTAHVGYAIGNIMPYVLGGLAVANNTYSLTGEEAATPVSVSASTTQLGYVVGAGLGAMLTDHVSGFVEGRYADYGIGNYALGLDSTTISEPLSLNDVSVRSGMNFHF